MLIMHSAACLKLETGPTVVQQCNWFTCMCSVWCWSWNWDDLMFLQCINRCVLL